MTPLYDAVWKDLAILLVLGHVLQCSADGQEIPPTLLQEDFKILRHALEEAHGGLYRYTSKADMDRIFDQAYRKIDYAMTPVEFWALVTPVIVHIKDGPYSLIGPRSSPSTNYPCCR